MTIAGAVVLSLFLAAPIAVAADPLTHNGRVIISTGDLTIPPAEHADAVVVVNGTATIEGEVNTVVAIDGVIVLTGARAETVVAIRSPVTVGPGTIVTGDVVKLDALVQQLGDAEVQGEVTDLAAALVGVGILLAPALFLLWIGFALATIVAALGLAGLAARQVRAAGAVIAREPVTAFIAGLLGLIVIPVLAVVLMLTILGAPLGFGVLFGLWPALAFVGYLVAAIWIGDWILRRFSADPPRERPYLAAVVGVLVLGALGLVPVLALVPALMSLLGLGAVIVLALRVLRGGAASQPVIPSSAPAAG
ncbi:MAG TPA: hypothetical protein VH720_01595 [Candidatus Limnocylindrales bacterium]|jgi:hypothetical protein